MSDIEQCDIAIIGAGAAGLAAGIFAAESSRTTSGAAPRIILLDGAKTIGAKILVSGGGRCNVTHDQITPEDYNGPRTIVRNVLAAFDERATRRWMESMGVQLKREETGKLFPVSNSARTVLDALLDRLKELGVEVWPTCKVATVELSDAQSSQFHIGHSNGDLLAKTVILCTGGRSLPRTGSDGFGYQIVRNLGHTVTDTYPALVPLVLDDSMFHARISGLSHEAELVTHIDRKIVDRRTGSLLWTHFGISGPLAMDASRFWTIARAKGQQVEMRCNFVAGKNFETVEQELIQRAAGRPKLSLVNALTDTLPARLAEALLHHIGIDPSLPLGQLDRESRRKLIHGLTSLSLPITRDRGWNYAEVTAGGVPVEEIDFRTMASRKVSGLFLAGEILDCDGRIGGFNFQWAWATGYLAGRGAAKKWREVM